MKLRRKWLYENEYHAVMRVLKALEKSTMRDPQRAHAHVVAMIEDYKYDRKEAKRERRKAEAEGR